MQAEVEAAKTLRSSPTAFRRHWAAALAAIDALKTLRSSPTAFRRCWADDPLVDDRFDDVEILAAGVPPALAGQRLMRSVDPFLLRSSPTAFRRRWTDLHYRFIAWTKC